MKPTAGRAARRHLPRSGGIVASLLVVGVLAVVLTVTGPPSARAAAASYSVEVAPTSELTDGKRVSITIKTGADHPVYQAEARVCRTGVAYQPSSGPRPSDDFKEGGANCPPNGVSTSADTAAISTAVFKYAPTPEGETVHLRVGVGVTAWTKPDGTTASLTCDEANPCALVVQLRTGPSGQAPTWVPVVHELTFRASDPVAGCGGPAPSMLSAGGSDALSDAWVGWTLGTCNTDGTIGAWTSLSFGEEANAVARFARGELDIAYSAVGYNDEAGFTGGIEAPRPAVAVPVGVGAAVLGLGNGYIDADRRKLPFSTVSLSLDEVTALLAGGEWATGPHRSAMITRNPELNSPDLFVSSASVLKVGAPAEAGSTPWIITRHLDHLGGDGWKVPDLPLFAPHNGRARGIHASLPLADPSFNNAVSTLSGRPGIAKALGGLPPEGGGVWLFTDSSTASAFDLQAVALENAAGTFVAPTPETMTAAVSTMVKDENGVRIPDPASETGYPLTYVVYAMVPAEPLADPTTNECRTASQDLLTRWLTYVTGEGQEQLPAGMVPLTDELRVEASAAIAEVGATPATVPCTTPTAPPPAAEPGALPVVGGPGAFGSSPGGAGPATAASAAASSGSVAAPAGAEAAAAANAELASASGDLPSWLGGALPSAILAMISLLGVVGLTSLAARVTSRQVPTSATFDWPSTPPEGQR